MSIKHDKLKLVDRLSGRVSRQVAHLVLILLAVFPLYALSGRWGAHGNADVIAVALPAYQLVNTGSVDVSDHGVFLAHRDDWTRAWFVELPNGEVVSNRPPGLIGLAIPAHVLIRQDSFSLGPTTLVALIGTILAVVLLWKVLIRMVGLDRATVAAVTLALGTTTWAVSSSQLWPHGPGQLWAAIAVSSLAAGSSAGAGWAYALSVTTRPLTAVFALITGLLESIRERAWSPVFKIGGTALVGALAVVAYNRVVFGDWSFRGGYGERFTVGAVKRFDLGDYVANVFQMFLGLPHGVLVTSPIVGVAVLGTVLVWKRIPGWARSIAVAGLVYLLVHAALNRASGGTAAFYRYPLEPLVLAAPALVLGAEELWDRGRLWRSAIGVGIVVSVGLQFWNVFYFSCSSAFSPTTACGLA